MKDTQQHKRKMDSYLENIFSASLFILLEKKYKLRHIFKFPKTAFELPLLLEEPSHGSTNSLDIGMLLKLFVVFFFFP